MANHGYPLNYLTLENIHGLKKIMLGHFEL